MDIALKDISEPIPCNCPSGFNPYSDGYCSERCYGNLGRNGSVGVSILILMDIALKGDLLTRVRGSGFQFQSLF